MNTRIEGEINERVDAQGPMQPAVKGLEDKQLAHTNLPGAWRLHRTTLGVKGRSVVR